MLCLYFNVYKKKLYYLDNMLLKMCPKEICQPEENYIHNPLSAF